MHQLRRGSSPDEIVGAVRERFQSATGEDRYELASLLCAFLVIVGRAHEQLAVLDEVMQEYPEDIQLPMSRAGVYLYSLDDVEAALKWIDIAIERADRRRWFRRQARGQKARILVELGRGDELSDVLEEIMALELKEGDLDIGRERDFVDRAPTGLIRSDVLDRYNEFRPKRSIDQGSDEPPKFELPDDLM